MNFEDRIKKAIQRGEKRRDARAEEARAEALNLDEIKRLHSQYRLQLSEHIETCVEQLTGHFPGFKFETIFGVLFSTIFDPTKVTHRGGGLARHGRTKFSEFESFLSRSPNRNF